MGTGAIIDASQVLDVDADRYVVGFRDENNETWTEVVTCDKIILQAGINPSYAEVVIKKLNQSADDEVGYNLILKNNNIKPNIRAYVAHFTSDTENFLLVGTVVNIVHDINTDNLVVTIMDDRWLLKKVTILGQRRYDYNLGESYAEDAECVFNQFGHPNCLDSLVGPVFAHAPRYGWDKYRTAEPEPGFAQSVARSWRIIDALKYLKYNGTISPSNPLYTTTCRWSIPDDIIWPDDFDLPDRPLRDFSIDGMDVLTALCKIIESCGARKLFLRPVSEEFRSELKIINFEAQTGSNEIIIPGMSSENLTSAIANNGVVSGILTEDIKDFYDEITILGDAPIIERSVGTKDNTIIPAWTEADEIEWRIHINTQGKNETAFKQARLKYPLVYAAWRINPNFNYLDNTPWYEKWTNRGRVHPRICPFLLTYDSVPYAEGPVDWIPKQIPIEINSIANGWYLASQADNLTISLDGSYFTLSGLADNKDTFEGSISNPTAIVARDLRLTLGIICDFKLSGHAYLDPNDTNYRFENLDPLRPPSQYIDIAKPLDYIYWYRVDSFPEGVDTPGEDFPDQILYNDSDRIQQHTEARLRKIKRITRSASIVFRCYQSGLQPGTYFSSVSNSEISYAGTITSVSIDANSQRIVVELS